jgi:hypothetical protein
MRKIFLLALIQGSFLFFYSCDNIQPPANTTQNATTALVQTPKTAGTGQECFEFENPKNKKEGAELTFLREGSDVRGNLQLKNGGEGSFHGTMQRDVAFCEWVSKQNGKTQKLKFQLTAPDWNGNNNLTLVFDEGDESTELKRMPCKGGKHL